MNEIRYRPSSSHPITSSQPLLQATHFGVPKATINIRFTSPRIYESPRALALTWLAAAILEDVACEQLYMAQLGGLGLYVQPGGA